MKAIIRMIETVALFGFVIILSPGLAVVGLMLLGDKVSGRTR